MVANPGRLLKMAAIVTKKYIYFFSLRSGNGHV
jgi:hypothetical protein